MYFDALQEVLSNSSKVIVDSKANGLIYLPLDKIKTGPKIAGDIAQSISSEQTSLLSQLDQLGSTRSDIRPINRPGRAN